ITGNVIFQSHEDDLADTLLPRCISAGADTNRISSIETENLNIDEDCGIIEQHIKETGARLLVFDPLQSFMGRNADMCRITDVRRLLSNLGAVAARNNCAVLIIAHQNKAQGMKDLYRVFGSVDITATARSVLRISVSENDPDIKIISHIKSSVSRPCAPIYFRFADDGSILYLDEYDEYDEDFDTEEIPDDSSKRARATEIIYTMLTASPREGTAVYKACEEAGISHRTVERVKKELNVGSERDETNRRMWVLQ
ncbi:MAG: AAA family ATPase, partial [Firmicutes bacterium]|nr:AAA family ATPase [Bacillota bacterium]